MPAVTIVAAWISAEIGVGPSHRADEQQDAGDRHQRPVHAGQDLDAGGGHLGRALEHLLVVEGAEEREHQADAEQEPEVADPVHQEGFQVRIGGCRALVPEADEQVGHQPDRFPAEEQLQEVVAHHQHEHREGEQRDVREEPLVARVVAHVADGVDVHHQRHRGHHQHHGGRQAVDQEAHLEAQVAGGEPGVDRTVERVALEHVEEHADRSGQRYRDPGDGDQVRAGTPDLATEQARDERPEQRREGNQQVDRLHRHRCALTLSTCRGRRHGWYAGCGTARPGWPARSPIRRQRRSG